MISVRKFSVVEYFKRDYKFSWTENWGIYRIFSNLIRTSFCRFLKRKKKLVRGSNPHLSFNRPLRAAPSEVGGMESHPGEHYRQIFQEVLHKPCFGRIRR